MADLPVVYNSFEGGLATDLKMGIDNSFAGTAGVGSLGTYAVDFRKSPSQLSILPQTSREDEGNVIDLVQNEVMTADGTIYAIGNDGNIYRRTTAGVWSHLGQQSTGTFGIDYRKDTDAIYICDDSSVSTIQKVSTAPTILIDYYGSSFSTYDNTNAMGFDVSSYISGGNQTYQLPTSISESAINKRYFQSDIEPLQKIGVYIPSAGKGTGNWTLTLHDGLDNNLGSVTIAAANLVNNAFNYFTFTTPVRIYVAPNARTYHIHVTSTVADGLIATETVAEMSDCDLEVYANRLVDSVNGMHPMTRFQQFECIGNSNYLSVWEPISEPPTNSEWLRHKLVFPSEYEVCGLSVFNEYLAIACERVSSSATTIPQDGIIFFWDGLSETYNYLTKIPEGSPYALHEYKNAIYYYAGGAWYGIASPTSTPVKIRTMPGSDTEYSGAAAPIKVYPYSVAVRRGIHLMGWPSETTDTDINFGVYSWGSVEKNYPDSFGYSYLISTDSTNYSVSNNLKIGMVKNFGDMLHISWQDSENGGYGIDIVDNSSPAATNATWESLIFDNGYVAKLKKGLYIQASFLDISDNTFRLKYKINRASNWEYSDWFSSTTEASASFNDYYARFDIADPSYFYELQIGCDVISSGDEVMTFTGFTLIFDDGREERLS